VKYAWIRTHEAEFVIAMMCKLLKVNRSGYYSWALNSTNRYQAEDDVLSVHIRTIFDSQRSRAGTRTIKKGLARLGYQVSRRRIGRLMKAHGMVCRVRKKFKLTTDSKHNLPIAPNLLNREFKVSVPNQCYVGDITYIPTQQGWLYLATVLDLFSRQVVGWSMKSHMRASLVNDALLMALWKRKPEKGLLWHTDRGSQYASTSHRDLLNDHRIVQSMSRKGDCWDNAVAESFFHSLKMELVHQTTFKTKEAARQAIFEYIEVFYNRIRMHSANDYLSPVEYEKVRCYA